MAAKEKANPLKMLVISMGFVLIGGTVMLMGVVWKKVSTEAVRVKTAGECAGGKLDLAGKGKITNLLIDGHIARITLEKDASTLVIASVDICSGKMLGGLDITYDKNTLQQD